MYWLISCFNFFIPTETRSTSIGIDSTPIGTRSTPIETHPTPIGTRLTSIGTRSTPIGIDPTPIGTRSTSIGIDSTPTVFNLFITFLKELCGKTISTLVFFSSLYYCFPKSKVKPNKPKQKTVSSKYR